MNYKISIVARGEGLTYEENGQQYHFGIHFSDNTFYLQLPLYGFGGSFERKTLKEPDYSRIVPRLISYLETSDSDRGVGPQYSVEITDNA